MKYGGGLIIDVMKCNSNGRQHEFIGLIDLTFMLVGYDDLSILTSKASECVRCCDSYFIGPTVKLDYNAVLEFGI